MYGICIAKTHLQVCSKLCIANLMTYGSQLLSFIAKKSCICLYKFSTTAKQICSLHLGSFVKLAKGF